MNCLEVVHSPHEYLLFPTEGRDGESIGITDHPCDRITQFLLSMQNPCKAQQD